MLFGPRVGGSKVKLTVGGAAVNMNYRSSLSSARAPVLTSPELYKENLKKKEKIVYGSQMAK